MIRTATVSKFYYRLNAGRTDGGIIPLGVVALLEDDAGLPTALVLLARRELRPEELAKIDWAAGKTLASPLNFLKREIDAALKERVANDVLHRLAQKFTWSIFASPPTRVTVPDEVANELATTMPSLSAPKRLKPTRGPGRVRVYETAPRALETIAGPEFLENPLATYLPPAWMLPQATYHPD